MGDLAVRLARGEDSAFAELYDACADRLHRYAWARLGSADAASDVLQSVFLRAVKSRRRFRGVENPAAYLFEIARNEIARAGAKRSRRREEALAATELSSVGAQAASDEDAEVARVALGRLAEEDREIVELKVYAGLTFAEIGALVARPAATVATRYRRAIESIRPWVQRQLK